MKLQRLFSHSSCLITLPTMAVQALTTRHRWLGRQGGVVLARTRLPERANIPAPSPLISVLIDHPPWPYLFPIFSQNEWNRGKWLGNGEQQRKDIAQRWWFFLKYSIFIWCDDIKSKLKLSPCGFVLPTLNSCSNSNTCMTLYVTSKA